MSTRPRVTSALPAIGVLLLSLSAHADPVISNCGYEEWDGAAPVDWEPVGDVRPTDECHSGAKAVLLTRDASSPPETGLNRAWTPGSGQQGKMLAPLKGAVWFWYKVLSAEPGAALLFSIIPMDATPLERTSARRASYEMPRRHYGDGQWHRGVVAYDYSAHPDVRWVHVAPRITGAGAQWIIDDVEWVESAGPFLTLDKVETLPGRAILRARLANAGDAPVEAPTVGVRGPDGLGIQPLDAAPLPKSLAPGGSAFRHWRLSGPRPSGSVVEVTATAQSGAEESLATTLPLVDDVECYSLAAERGVLSVGDEIQVLLAARNHGDADSEPLSLDLSLPPELELVGDASSPEPLPAGAWTTQSFRLRAVTETPGTTVTGAVRWGDKSAEVSTRICVGAAPGPDSPSLQSGDMRIVFAHSEWGYGPGFVSLRVDGQWRTVARIANLGRLRIRSSDGEEELRFGGRPGSERLGVSFDDEKSDSAGGLWHSSVTLEPGPVWGSVSMTYSLSCDSERDVLLYEGPRIESDLLGGDALFPGLEWTEGWEVTSSALDIARDHPDRLRFAPDPMKITIPLLATSSGESTLGLLWDRGQLWGGGNDRPTATFCAPGYLAGLQPAVMGLVAPSVYGGWLRENTLYAERPYRLGAGQLLTLSAVLVGLPRSASSLDTVTSWIGAFGLPEPSVSPRGAYAQELQFSARAYSESLRDPADGKWWVIKGWGPFSDKVAGSPQHAWDLLQAAAAAEGDERKQQLTALADEIAKAAGHAPSGYDEGLQFGSAVEWPRRLAWRVVDLIAHQLPDGSWIYDADRQGTGPLAGVDYWELGDSGWSALGTCAQNASDILRFARITGDGDARAAGVKALEFMDRFRVPRAAQVWEVPFHAPDVLAAAEAVDAYLDAYEIDGNERWLERAVYWARAGLPFVYLWGDSERPYLRYASIPVFGATLYRGSWFGRPVQWCGLVYGRALHRLASRDTSVDWRRVAEGILASALWQQNPDGPDVALWPDSIGADKGDKAGPFLAPSLLIEQLCTLLGRDPHPRTVAVGSSPDTVQITAPGDVTDASWDGSELAFSVAYPDGLRGGVLVANTSAPSSVTVDGQAAEFTYDQSAAYLAVSIPEAGSHSVRVSGASFVAVDRTPEAMSEIEFAFDSSAEGWSAEHAIADLRVADGALVLTTGEADPFISRAGLIVEGKRGDALEIRMMLTGGDGDAQVYWGVAEEPGMSEARSFWFQPLADGEWHVYRLPLGTGAQWAGRRIAALRFDPCQTGPAQVEIDSIRLLRTGPTGRTRRPRARAGSRAPTPSPLPKARRHPVHPWWAPAGRGARALRCRARGRGAARLPRNGGAARPFHRSRRGAARRG